MDSTDGVIEPKQENDRNEKPHNEYSKHRPKRVRSVRWRSGDLQRMNVHESNRDGSAVERPPVYRVSLNTIDPDLEIALGGEDLHVFAVEGCLSTSNFFQRHVLPMSAADDGERE